MKILIVEDSKFARTILAKTLQENIPDATIIAAGDGMDGFESYQREKPDLIITDLLMPRVNGQEFIQKLRLTDTHTPVVIISADIQNATRDEMAQLGILSFINKPLSAEKAAQLLGLIKEIAHA